jgi:hypothetical protein
MADWRAPLMSAVCYLDPKAAIAWLERAFGFWTVAQTVETVTREQAEEISGLKITGWV